MDLDSFFTVSADNLFVNSFQQQYKLESLSNQALSKGIDLYVKKDYEGAATEFERSINLSPNSDFAIAATKHLAQTYLKQEKPDKAIEAYQNAIKRNPTEESLHAELGKILFSEDRYEEAAKSYQAAVDINPSSVNQYSLGQGLMKVGNYNGAKSAFDQVIRLEPKSPYGYAGLGQVYAQDGDYKRAIEQFETAISKQSDYYDAYLDMGYAYADMGDMDKAKEIQDFLEGKDEDLSALLDGYVNKVEPPKMLFAWGTSSFRYSKTFKTPVAVLDSYLANADASKSMNIKIQFSKDMDRSSIENTLNWNISRATGPGLAQTYNFGDEVPETEANIDAIPDYVLYDEDKRIATISFTIRQNATADATIDPSHIIFKFNGKDAEGNVMDSDHDEFSGFSHVA